MVEDELGLLKELLREDWSEFTYGTNDGFVTVEVLDGDHRRWSSYQTVITRGPSGQHYRWGYEQGHTEYQENYRDDNEVTRVKPVTKQVTITEWEPDE